jgi:DNA-binding beta-propeller fold protein YncE
MRFWAGFPLLLAIAFAADQKKLAAPANGIRTPGVQIPFASLKSELTFELAEPAAWIAFSESIWIPAQDGLQRIDPKAKESKFGEPITGMSKPCGGLVSAFTSIWTPACGDRTLARVDAKAGKVNATIASGTGAARPAIAATADSVWMFTDARGTLSRIDPLENRVVAELRVHADCNTLAFGEAALWTTCPAENRVLRVDPQTNLVDKSIEIAGGPAAIAIGEGSVWVLRAQEGKIDRIDPKTNKVTKTIELGAPAAGGTIAIGEGSLWASIPGFPITRVDPAGEKVVRQFWGAGAGVIQTGGGSVWLANSHAGQLWKFDPKRISATLAE